MAGSPLLPSVIAAALVTALLQLAAKSGKLAWLCISPPAAEPQRTLHTPASSDAPLLRGSVFSGSSRVPNTVRGSAYHISFLGTPLCITALVSLAAQGKNKVRRRRKMPEQELAGLLEELHEESDKMAKKEESDLDYKSKALTAKKESSSSKKLAKLDPESQKRKKSREYVAEKMALEKLGEANPALAAQVTTALLKNPKKKKVPGGSDAVMRVRDKKRDPVSIVAFDDSVGRIIAKDEDPNLFGWYPFMWVQNGHITIMLYAFVALALGDQEWWDNAAFSYSGPWLVALRNSIKFVMYINLALASFTFYEEYTMGPNKLKDAIGWFLKTLFLGGTATWQRKHRLNKQVQRSVEEIEDSKEFEEVNVES